MEHWGECFARHATSETADEGVHFTTINMPLVRTPMIAPTKEYRDAAALIPEQAADIVLRAIVTGERQIGTRVARLVSLGHAVAPQLVERLVGRLHRQATGAGTTGPGVVVRTAHEEAA